MLVKEIENVEFVYYKIFVNELADKIVKEIIHIVLKQVDFNEYFLLLVVKRKGYTDRVYLFISIINIKVD